MNLKSNIVVTVLSNGSVLTYCTYDLTKAYSYNVVSNVLTLQTSGVSNISFVEGGEKATVHFGMFERSKISPKWDGCQKVLPKKKKTVCIQRFLNLLRAHKSDLLHSQHQKERLIFFGLNRLFKVFPGLVIGLQFTSQSKLLL